MIKQTYMLDTNMCAVIMRSKPQALLQALQAHVQKRHKVVISAITYAELRFGASVEHNDIIDAFMARIEAVLPWDKAAIDATKSIKQHLADEDISLGQNDTMIAGHAVAANCVLITNNIKDFEQVPDLVYDDWTNGVH